MVSSVTGSMQEVGVSIPTLTPSSQLFDPSTISVAQTLSLLDSSMIHLRDGVSERRFALWLGSGISLGRADGLSDVLVRLLEFLRVRVVPGDPADRHLAALRDVLSLASVPAGFDLSVEVSRDAHTWPGVRSIAKSLAANYARALDVRVDGEEDDYLVWEGIDVKHSYVGALKPDAEHFAIAVLYAESVITQGQSANWDGLIEAAFEDLAIDGIGSPRVVVLQDDFRGPSPRARLLKFHGCAVRAASEEAVYRRAIVARQTQISSWTGDHQFDTMREHLVHSALESKALVIGLSAQDENIRNVFATAASRQHWSWPEDPGAAVFAEEQIGLYQGEILKQVYGSSYSANQQSIKESALIPAYGKPLLTALVLTTWESKFARYIEISGVAEELKSAYKVGIRVLRDTVAGAIEPINAVSLRSALGTIAHVLGVYRSGVAATRYLTIDPAIESEIQDDPALVVGGNVELACVLGMLGAGAAAGLWNFRLPATEATSVQLIGASATRMLALFANGGVLAAAVAAGKIDLNDPSIAVCLGVPDASSATRSAIRKYGRTGRTSSSIFSIADVQSDADIETSLRQFQGRVLVG